MKWGGNYYRNFDSPLFRNTELVEKLQCVNGLRLSELKFGSEQTQRPSGHFGIQFKIGVSKQLGPSLWEAPYRCVADATCRNAGKSSGGVRPNAPSKAA
jgi:hypothetical protein